MADQPKLYL